MDAKKKSGGESSMPRSLQKINDRSTSLKAELNSSHRGRGAKSRLSSHAEEDDNGADAKLKAQVKTLKEDLDRRQVRAYACSGVVAHPCDDSGSVPRAMQQASYLRRERDYRTRVKLLEEELDKVCSVPVCCDTSLVTAQLRVCAAKVQSHTSTGCEGANGASPGHA